MAKNDITQQDIKTSPSNEAYRKGWSDIFLKDASEWLLFLYNNEVRILDPDGWKLNDGVTLETKIRKQDFNDRLARSTICHVTDKPIKINYI
jgi:hypothetical protein